MKASNSSDRKASELHAKLRDHLIETLAMDKTTSDLMSELYAEIRALERTREWHENYQVMYREYIEPVQVADDLTEAINEGQP